MVRVLLGDDFSIRQIDINTLRFAVRPCNEEQQETRRENA
jgi:hypothetical protein